MLEKHTVSSTIINKKEAKANRQATATFHKAINGQPPKSAHDAIRVLIAGGMVKWAEEAKKGRLRGTISAPYLPEFLAFICWPVISAPRLPKHWSEALYEMSSIEIMELVKAARSKFDKDLSTQLLLQITRELHDLNFKVGLENLMADFNDPRRGGAAFIALSHAYSATSGISAHQMLKALGVMATSGVVGTAAWQGVSSIADDLEAQASETVANHSTPMAQGSGTSSANSTSNHHRGAEIIFEHALKWFASIFPKF